MMHSQRFDSILPSALSVYSGLNRLYSILETMAFIGDTTPISLQLKLTNYAESFESCYHVWRISFVVTILDDVDDVGKPFEKLSEEDQQVLNWQKSLENLQNDVEVRDTLTQQSGRLCPYKNISTSLYDKVKSAEGTRQRKGDHPLSAYEQISFRSAMLTKHSAGNGQADGQPELLALHDGLGGEQSFLRWRSHDYIKVSLCKPRQKFRVFWLIQWDIVGKLRDTGSPDDAEPATMQGRRRRSSIFNGGSMMHLGTDSEKFHGVRYNEKRKSPWIAEVRRKGERKKIWLGSYKIKEAAARAADAGSHYYDREDMLNFRDSPQYLEPIPLVLSDESKEEFVKAEAHRLAELTEMKPSRLPSSWDHDYRTTCSTSTEDFTELQAWDYIGGGSNSIVDNIQQETIGNLDGGSPSSDGVAQLLMTSERDSGKDLDVQLSSSYGGEILQEIVGSSPEENVWPLTPTDSFTANLHGGVGALFRPLGQADTCQHALSPLGNCSPNFDATDTMLICDTYNIWGDQIVALDTPGDGDIDGLYNYWSCGSGLQAVEDCELRKWTQLHRRTIHIHPLKHQPSACNRGSFEVLEQVQHVLKMSDGRGRHRHDRRLDICCKYECPSPQVGEQRHNV